MKNINAQTSPAESSVMVPQREIGLDDLPPELHPAGDDATQAAGWQDPFRQWVDRQLAAGQGALARTAIAMAESILITASLEHTHGHRERAARCLGYGRNTLTRKISEEATRLTIEWNSGIIARSNPLTPEIMPLERPDRDALLAKAERDSTKVHWSLFGIFPDLRILRNPRQDVRLVAFRLTPAGSVRAVYRAAIEERECP
jgi:DNA-binding protein Fis